MGYEDVRAMLMVAHHGQSVGEWKTGAIQSSRLPSSSRRAKQLVIAERILRPVDGHIVADEFLADLHAADDPTARDLVYARYFAATPLAVKFAHELLAPHAILAGKVVCRDAVDDALARLLPGVKPSTFARSRTAALTEFARAGVIRPARDGSFEVLRASPSHIAFYHLLCDDLADRHEATYAWVARSSLGAAVFALAPEQVTRYLDALVEEGRLRRSYYSGEPRILAA